MSGEPSMDWQTAVEALSRWHAHHDRHAGRAAIAFLEVELQQMVPPLVRRTWPPDLIEDVVRELLRWLIEHPLPTEGIGNIRGYFRVTLRRRCLDEYDRRLRRPEDLLARAGVSPEDHLPAVPSALDAATDRDRAEQLHAALRQLKLPDRVALKLEHAPDWLDDEEAEWLAAGIGCSVSEARAKAAETQDMYEITRLFDPGDDDPSDAQARRKRMERFRKRRDRARDQMLELLKGKV